ncbi:MAG: glucose-6-phosphate dehydrogenase [Candidatus Moraniibacteriota bacterium]|nr:MAG: glucose-6-phosphate dehydrogenase [Candidatus Moranbacteria bacterium]
MTQKISQEKIKKAITFLIFGITGDLSRKKLIPSLWDLYCDGILTKGQFRIIGLSRSEYGIIAFQEYVREVITKTRSNVNEEMLKSFSECFIYEIGVFEDPDIYKQLTKQLRFQDKIFGSCSEKIVYLAVSPERYETIFENIHFSGLLRTCSENGSLGRILVEKPFGKNTQTAQLLDDKLGALFEERQIFRIDHYLAKETIQNILNFRFANHIFEPLWNKDHIESVEIRLVESFGIEGRGNFYDGIGALRDVGQNHILQMLAMTAMESPSEFSDTEIRSKRFEILRYLNPLCIKDTFGKINCSHIVRGQYRGYRNESGVDPNSQTETYFRITAHIDTEKWRGVPFYLESGKGMDVTQTFIRVNFKKSNFGALCPIGNPYGCGNSLTFHIKPNEGISLCFWAKRTGFSKELERKTLRFSYEEGDNFVRIPDAYEHVLLETIRNDQTLFPSTDEVKAQWAFITPILEQWKNLPLIEYDRGSSSVG